MPEKVSDYLHARLDEFQHLARELRENPAALAESWLRQLVHAAYTGWQPSPMIPLPEVTTAQEFCVAIEPLSFVEYKEKVIVPCDSGILSVTVNLTPFFLQRLASVQKKFTIPEVLSWQQNSSAPSPGETLNFLKALYKYGIIQKV